MPAIASEDLSSETQKSKIKLKCINPNCNIKFDDEAKLREHVDSHANGKTEIQADPTVTKCSVCSVQFDNEAQLEIHVKVKHLNLPLRRDRSGSKAKTRNNFQFETKVFSVPPVGNGTTSISSLNPPPESTESKRPKRRISRNKPYPLPSSRISKRLRRDSTSKDLPKVATSAAAAAAPDPELQAMELPRQCNLCKLSYRSHNGWKKHVINDHILKRDPEPRIEMNYVNLSISGCENPIITTGTGKVQEQLKLTFCRDKGSYVVKNTSFNEELTGLQKCSSTSHSRSEGSGEGDSCPDKENNEPAGLQSVSTGRGGKVPTSGTVVYLNPSASESEKALANSNNSHMVIIQNDILRIGADADEENIQRITAATTQVKKPQVKDAMILNTCDEAVKGKDATIASILSMPPYARPRQNEITAMVYEEIPNSFVIPERGNKSELASEEARTKEATNPSSQNGVTQERENESESDENDNHGPTEESEKDIANATEETPKATNENSNPAPAPTPKTLTPSPLHITLPCGIEIEQLPIISLNGENRRVLSESEGESQRNELIISEAVPSREDDFRCKVCNELFMSDEDLETHFSESHFRGIANSILEEPPDSPWVGDPPPAHASSQSSIFGIGTLSREDLQNFSIPRTAAPDLLRDRRVSDPERHIINPQLMNALHGPMQIPQGHQATILATPNNHSPSYDRNSIVGPGRTQIHYATAEMVQPPLPAGMPLPLPGSVTTTTGYQISMSRPMGNLQNRIPIQMQQPQTQPQRPQFHLTQNGAPPRPVYSNLQNSHNSGVQQQQQRPMPIIRHPSQNHDGPRLVDVTAMGHRPQQPQTQPQSQAQQQQQQQRNHMIAMAQHQRQQQQYQLLQQQNLRQRQEQNQREREQRAQGVVTVEMQRQLEMQRQQTILEQQRRIAQTNQQQQAQIFHHYTSPQQQQQLQGKRPSSMETNSAQKQPRLEGQPHVLADTRTVGRPIYSVPPRSDHVTQVSSTTSSLASALGNGGIRLGTSVTLSVCAGDETNNNNRRQSPNDALRNSAQGPSPHTLNRNPNEVASALAVRGVTVTPASPPSSDHHTLSSIPTHRLPPQLSISPNPAEVSNSVSVIQNGSSPNQQHTFAVPQNPAPRISVLQVSDRPDRPPTVDLTNDDGTPFVPGQPHFVDRRSSALSVQAFRPPPARPAVSCNLCGVLFCSLSTLEEHKIHRHGFRSTGQSQAPRSQTQGPSPPIRPTQAQNNAAVRPSNGVFRPSQQPVRSLFLPIIDFSRMDPSKMKKLEEFGVVSMIPLQGNERAFGQLGIPILIPMTNGQAQSQVPWDQVQSLGPVYSPAQLAQNFASRQNSTHK